MDVQWSMIGVHNVTNACAVAATAMELGVSLEVLKQAFESFRGIQRRMTLVGEVKGVKVFDDFAHHPTAIASMVSSARASMSGEGRLWVVIEPRSNTMRTKIHQSRLPQCFDGADFVIFVPPAPRGMQQDELLDVNTVCHNIGEHAQVLPDAATIVDFISAHAKAGDSVLILSNGGFEGIHQRLLARLGQ